MRILFIFIMISFSFAALLMGDAHTAPAARQGDQQNCPMITGLTPHVGGPIILGVPTVLICGMPAATVGKNAVCVGPPSKIIQGASTVLIGGMPAARIGDRTDHGGTIIGPGCPTVLIGP